MIRLRILFALVKKEIASHFDTPSTSIGLIIFIVLWQFLFFRNALLVGEVSLRMLYDYLPWMLLLFASAVTMGIFVQEKNEGTIELLLTHPVKVSEIIVSKFLGSLFLVGSSLLFAIPIAISFSQFGVFDWGAFAGQFISGVLLASCFIALGMFLSSFLTTPIAALLSTAAVSFFLVIGGSEFITANVPLFIVPIFERLSLLSHVSSMARGVIDIRDVWYFISFICIFLSLSFLMLIKQKFGNRREYYIRYQIGISLFIAIAIVSNILGSRIPGRIDLTSDKKYSISSSTQVLLGGLTDIVTITFYASSRLPSQLTPVVRDTKDILRDYQQYGKGNVSVIQKDPSSNGEISSEASSRGVKEVQFNVIGQEEFQIKTGFVGIVISYGGKHETIPLIQHTGDLEYQMTSLIAKLTTKEKKKIVFLSGHGEKNISTDYSLLNEELQNQFIVESITVDSENPVIASDAAVLVIAGPTQSIDNKSREAIESYLNTGKSALFLIDTHDINPQLLKVSENQHSFADFLNQFGISVALNVAYDLRSNETIRMGQGNVSVLLPYPFWIRALPSQSTIVQRLHGVSLPWSASITFDDQRISSQGFKVEKLLTTSPYADTQSENIVLNPNVVSFSKNNLKEQTLAVVVSGPKQSSTNVTGNIIVVGDSDFLTDQFVQNTPQNLTFGIVALAYLAEQNSFSDIRIKQSELPKLIFSNQFQQTLIKYGNMGIGVVIPAGFVLFRLLKRKSKRNQPYHI